MRISVLLFAVLAEQLGTRQLDLHLPAGASAGAVWEHLRRGHAEWGEVGKAVVLAVNGEFQPPTMRLHEGDTVALLPPMSGGTESPLLPIHIALVRGPLPPPPVFADPRVGAVVSFAGVSRDHTPAAPGHRVLRLQYEAYEEMARTRLEAIAAAAAARWPLLAIEAVHRLGDVPVGEASVRVTVAAAHRDTAFCACRHILDTLKCSVPIWKKEFFADGSRWVDGAFPEPDLTASAAPRADNRARPGD